MKKIKFTTRTRQTDGFGQTISIDVYSYAETGIIFRGKPFFELVKSYTVYNKNYKALD